MTNSWSAPRPFTLAGIWAHPDDESYLSAALMRRVVAAGGRVAVVSATRGEHGTDDERVDPAVFGARRERELRLAMSALGVHDVRVLGYPDGGCAAVEPSQPVERLTALLRSIRPDLVVTFGPDGITRHPDHVAVGSWTARAWARVRSGRLLFATMTDSFVARHRAHYPELPLTLTGEPAGISEDQVVLRIIPDRNERRAKRAALTAHSSQTGPLAAMLGERRFYDWWDVETFRAPAAELDERDTAGIALAAAP